MTSQSTYASSTPSSFSTPFGQTPEGLDRAAPKSLELEAIKDWFEEHLRQWAKTTYGTSELGEYGPAMRYAILGPGKRLRPMLTLLCHQAFSEQAVPWQKALPAAMAIEMIHTYSLVHDDLPCMDDDDLRRGRPTVHKVFDDGMAVLVGDGLLTDAMRVALEPSLVTRISISESEGEGEGERKVDHAPTEESALALTPDQRLQLGLELTRASGSEGMVSGQALDLYWTQRTGYQLADLKSIHLAKTGALMGAATATGAILAGFDRDSAETKAARVFGEAIGLSFQIQDDMLDTLPSTGKTAGKDAQAGKLTYAKFLTFDQAHHMANQLIETAWSEVAPVLKRPEVLATLQQSLQDRRA